MKGDDFEFYRRRIEELRGSNISAQHLDMIEAYFLREEDRTLSYNAASPDKVRTWVSDHGNSPELIRAVLAASTFTPNTAPALVAPLPEGLADQITRVGAEIQKVWALLSLDPGAQHVVATYTKYRPGATFWRMGQAPAIVTCKACEGKGFADEKRVFRCGSCDGHGNRSTMRWVPQECQIDHLIIEPNASVKIRVVRAGYNGYGSLHADAMPYIEGQNVSSWLVTLFDTPEACQSYIEKTKS